MSWVVVSVCLFTLVSLSVRASAEICQEEICEYHFEVRRVRTMTYKSPQTGQTYKVNFNGSDLHVEESSLHPAGFDPMVGKVVDEKDVITTDGFVRNIIVINGQFPGPSIEVMEGAQVVVHVTNYLLMEGITIHWHGNLMQATPWMDGVPYVTQCPILPRQSFTYRFKANPVGTHWYHSHFGHQRMDGLFGMMVVHSRLPPNPEYLLSVMEWWHPDAEFMELAHIAGVWQQGIGDNYDYIPKWRYAVDGTVVSAMIYYSTLINGRGRLDDTPLPLTDFTVKSGTTYRFRVVHTGAERIYVISVDGHRIRILASDGADISPIDADSFMIYAGETMDFELLANQEAGSYWVRATHLEGGLGTNLAPEVISDGKAVLRYEGFSQADGDPTSEPRECTEGDPCIVFNCPFAGYADSHHKRCISLADAQSSLGSAQLQAEYGLQDDDIEEHIFNFNFMPAGGNINGRRFKAPRAPMTQGDHEDYVEPCHSDPTTCEAAGCLCTHTRAIPVNKTVQFVITNYMPTNNGTAAHNAHLHGHNFAVLKIGYPDYDKTTGRWAKENSDIMCDNPLCFSPRWNGTPPDLNLKNPPIKDSVIVPARGYTVIRFQTRNPGVWLLHCHFESHFIEGMAMAIIEGNDLPPAPPNFPQCRNFDWTAEEFEDYTKGKYAGDPVNPCDDSEETASSEEKGDDDHDGDDDHEEITLKKDELVGLVVGFFALGAMLFTIPFLVYMCRLSRSTKKV